MFNPICPKCQQELTLPEEIPQEGIRCPKCKLLQQIFVPGTMLGNYRILRFLSCGNMGCVYIAEQVTVGRKVALKVLDHAKAQTPGWVEKFLNEARNTVRFSHPNIVNAIDAGCFDNVYCIAVQYVEGENLETLLNRGKIYSPTEALRIVLTVAEALKTIWNKTKMFHRDIKPANIMITPEGDPMLLDMGIAQNLGEVSLEEGEIEGTPLYMSPEQAKGEKLSWSTDCYSLGVTLFHMVTGAPPFWDEEIPKLLEKHCFSPLPNPDKVLFRTSGQKVRFPDTFRRILEKMLAKKQEARYRSWEDALEDMTGALILLEELQSTKRDPMEEQKQRMAILRTEGAEEPKTPTPVQKLSQVIGRYPLPITVCLLFLLIAVPLGIYWNTVCKREICKTKELLQNLQALSFRETEANLKTGQKIYEKLRELSANSLPVNLFYAGKIKTASQPLWDAVKILENEKERFLNAQKKCFETLDKIYSQLEDAGAKVYPPANRYSETAHIDLPTKFIKYSELMEEIREEFNRCKQELQRQYSLYQFPGTKKAHSLLLPIPDRNSLAFENAIQLCKQKVVMKEKAKAEEKKRELAGSLQERPEVQKKDKVVKQVKLSPAAIRKMELSYRRQSYRALKKLVQSFHTDFKDGIRECREQLQLPPELKNNPGSKPLEQRNLAMLQRLQELHQDADLFHQDLSNSAKRYKDFTMRLPKTGKTATLQRIKAGELLLVNGYDNYELRLEELSKPTLEALAGFAAKKNLEISRHLLGYYLRLRSYDKALELVQPTSLDRGILRIFLNIYFLDEYKKNRGTPTRGLTRKYQNTPEYKKIFRKKAKGKK